MRARCRLAGASAETLTEADVHVQFSVTKGLVDHCWEAESARWPSRSRFFVEVDAESKSPHPRGFPDDTVWQQKRREGIPGALQQSSGDQEYYADRPGNATN